MCVCVFNQQCPLSGGPESVLGQVIRKMLGRETDEKKRAGGWRAVVKTNVAIQSFSIESTHVA